MNSRSWWQANCSTWWPLSSALPKKSTSASRSSTRRTTTISSPIIHSFIRITRVTRCAFSFGIVSGHRYWLQPDKRILEHDLLLKKSGVLVLYFSVKFYVENVALTRDKCAIEFFFLQARLLISQGELDIATAASGNELAYELAALVLQSTLGDYKRYSPLHPSILFLIHHK